MHSTIVADIDQFYIIWAICFDNDIIIYMSNIFAIKTPSNNKIKDIPKELRNLSYVKYVTLFGNDVTNFSRGILNLRNLVTININGNKIKDDIDYISTKTVPKLKSSYLYRQCI